MLSGVSNELGGNDAVAQMQESVVEGMLCDDIDYSWEMGDRASMKEVQALHTRVGGSVRGYIFHSELSESPANDSVLLFSMPRGDGQGQQHMAAKSGDWTEHTDRSRPSYCLLFSPARKDR